MNNLKECGRNQRQPRAVETKYHKKCLTGLYNKFKSKKKSEKSETALLREIEGKALKDVVDYVKDTITACHEGNGTPVLTQKSLTDLYKERIIYHGMSVESVDALAFSEVAHCTHLRNAIMDNVPGICVAKSGRTVSLTLHDEVVGGGGLLPNVG